MNHLVSLKLLLPKFACVHSLYNQQLAHQAAIFNNIRHQAVGGGGGSYGSYGGAGGYGGGNSVGSYGGTSGGGSYGGTYGGGSPSYAPNYASAGGSVGNGYQQQHASIYPANPVSLVDISLFTLNYHQSPFKARPNLDSRFGNDDSHGGGGVTYSQSGGPGFSGVSSFSSSSDVNGVKHRESATSVNNNGKVTTYHTRN
jgi:hypothetical protein